MGAAYLWRGALLIGLANLWIISDPIIPADAVVILGGGLQYRALEALKLQRQGIAPQLLVVNVRRDASDLAGVTEPEHVLVKRLLTKEGARAESMAAKVARVWP